MADGVVFLPSFHEAIKDLPDAERLGVYDAVIRYGLYGEIVEMPPVVKAMFALMKPVIDSSQRRYRAAKENGSKGGRPRKNQTENQRKNQTGNQDIETEKDIDMDSEKDSDYEDDLEKDADGEGESLSGGGETNCIQDSYKQRSEQEFERLRQEAQEKLFAAMRNN